MGERPLCFWGIQFLVTKSTFSTIIKELFYSFEASGLRVAGIRPTTPILFYEKDLEKH